MLTHVRKKVSEAINGSTDNTIAKRKRGKKKAIAEKTLHRKLE
jgi:hypothetical protein